MSEQETTKQAAATTATTIEARIGRTMMTTKTTDMDIDVELKHDSYYIGFNGA